MRRDYAKQVKRLGYGVYSKRLCDALITVQLLDLPQTTYQLREMANSWLNWLTPLRLAPERDPALEYWHVLTRQQREDTNPATWLHLANDPRHEYLNVALIGLQRLPTAQNAQRNQQTQLLAVLQHAVLLADSGAAHQFFNRHYATLRAIYPAGPEHWETLLAAVLTNFRGKSKVAKELLEKLRQPATPSHQSKQVTHSVTVQPADKSEFDNLFSDINKSRHAAESLAQRFFAILDRNYIYAKATGDSYFFVLTLSKHGTKLLKYHKLAIATLNRLQQMIERGLSLEPMNPFIWMLWANCLAHLNQPEAQQWVLREAARLFPNDEPSRVELARLLMRQGNDKEAEKWLRDVVALSPNDGHSRVELARLLMRQGDELDELQAEQWLRGVIASRVELARLLMKRGDDKQAREWLSEVSRSREELAQLLMRGNEHGKWGWSEIYHMGDDIRHGCSPLSYYLRGRQFDDKLQAEQGLLRELIKMSPHELAQLLMEDKDYRDDDYKQARKWLFEVIDSRVELARLLIRLMLQEEELRHEESLCRHCRLDGDERRCLQLAQLLMQQGNDKEAEQWLRKVVALSPNDETLEAEKLLTELLARNPQNPKARDESDEILPNAVKLTTLEQLLQELQRRADLQIEFNQADKLDKIQQDAAQGDALACLYQQWLQPDTLANSPPYAWAAQACRLYQTHASAEQWAQFNQTFPEKRLLNRFVSVQQTDNQDEFNALLNKLAHDKESHTPLQDFMYQMLQPGHAYDKDKATFAVLASAAVDAPQFMMG